jgi:hypothetical protein
MEDALMIIKSYAALDVRNGGIDGWYGPKEMAINAVVYWREKLGHNQVVLVELIDTLNGDIAIGPCFLADRVCNMRRDHATH